MARTHALTLVAVALGLIATAAASTSPDVAAEDGHDTQPAVANVLDAYKTGEDSNQDDKPHTVNALDTAADAADAAKEAAEDDARDAKLLAYFSTTTLTSVRTSTKLALSTCYSTSDKACTGKRKRRTAFQPGDLSVRQLTADDLELDGSFDSGDQLALEDGSSRSGRKLTVWSTGYTTVTITTTSYYAGTTVSISAVCTVAGDGQSCFG